MIDLAYGPLNKNIFTYELELIAKCALHELELVNFSYEQRQGKFELFATIGEREYNVSELMLRANFSHVVMSKEDSTKFQQKFSYSTIGGSDLDRWNNNNLNLAEIDAIRVYTLSGYAAINDLLYQKQVYEFDDFKRLFLIVMMLSSAINKIPNILVNDSLFTYRGEGSTGQIEIDGRIEHISNGGAITIQPAFMSSSFDKSIARSFSDRSLIKFEGVYCKDFIRYSLKRHELEILLLPGYVLWKAYKNKDGKHLFKAQLVNPLVGAVMILMNKISLILSRY
jgi:hypothetical protein